MLRRFHAYSNSSTVFAPYLHLCSPPLGLCKYLSERWDYSDFKAIPISSFRSSRLSGEGQANVYLCEIRHACTIKLTSASTRLVRFEEEKGGRDEAETGRGHRISQLIILTRFPCEEDSVLSRKEEMGNIEIRIFFILFYLFMFFMVILLWQVDISYCCLSREGHLLFGLRAASQINVFSLSGDSSHFEYVSAVMETHRPLRINRWESEDFLNRYFISIKCCFF